MRARARTLGHRYLFAGIVAHPDGSLRIARPTQHIDHQLALCADRTANQRQQLGRSVHAQIVERTQDIRLLRAMCPSDPGQQFRGRFLQEVAKAGFQRGDARELPIERFMFRHLLAEHRHRVGFQMGGGGSDVVDTKRKDSGPYFVGVNDELVKRGWMHDYGTGQVADRERDAPARRP